MMLVCAYEWDDNRDDNRKTTVTTPRTIWKFGRARRGLAALEAGQHLIGSNGG
jgi:hypothetical protein